jgi:predicted phosphodiesterase
MDYPEIVTRYPEDQRIILADNEIFMTHNGGMLLRSPPSFRARVGSKRPNIFIWGHTHRSENRMIDGMLSLNPGPAGSPRAEHPSSAAIITLEPGETPRAEIFSLED